MRQSKVLLAVFLLAILSGCAAATSMAQGMMLQRQVEQAANPLELLSVVNKTIKSDMETQDKVNVYIVAGERALDMGTGLVEDLSVSELVKMVATNRDALEAKLKELKEYFELLSVLKDVDLPDDLHKDIISSSSSFLSQINLISRFL